jgi:hypothetical protein
MCDHENGPIKLIEAETGFYDEIEYEPEVTVSGKALWELLSECKRWRASHASEGFNPDWCAAKDALRERLKQCHSASGVDLCAIERMKREPRFFIGNQPDDEVNGWNAAIDAMREILKRSPVSVPGGYTLVPNTPTLAMEDAWTRLSLYMAYRVHQSCPDRETFWNAMLSAAQSPTLPKEEIQQ